MAKPGKPMHDVGSKEASRLVIVVLNEENDAGSFERDRIELRQSNDTLRSRPVKSLLKILLALAFVNLAPALAKEPKQAVASPALQQEFDAFIAKFRAALSANDSAAVAGMTKLPFMNESATGDAAQFRAKIYPTTFTAKNRACIQRSKAVYDRDPEKHDNYFIFCGDVIFAFTKTPAGFLFTDVGAND